MRFLPPSAVLALVFICPVQIACANPGGLFEPGSFPALAGPFPAVEMEAAANEAVAFDADGDGDQDLFLVFGTREALGTGDETSLPDRLYLNDGGGVFAAAATAFDSAPARCGAAATAVDLDRDGRDDLVVAGCTEYDAATNSVRRDPSVWYRNLGGAAFGAGVTLGSEPAVDVLASDLDGDGDSDLAILQSNGGATIFRNDTAPGAAITFTVAQTLPATVFGGGRFASGRYLSGDALPDLAMLQPRGSPNAPAGVVFWRNAGALNFQRDVRVPINNGQPRDLASADFDGDGMDDLVVVASGSLLGQSDRARMIYLRANGPELVDDLFFRASLRGVIAADVTGDARPDLIFAQLRPPVSDLDTPSLLVVYNTPAGFRSNGQCFGRFSAAPKAMLTARLDGDALPDLFVLGLTPAAPPQSSTGWWRNGASLKGRECCPVQLAAQHINPWSPSLSALQTLTSLASVDVGAYSRVRDELLANSSDGARLRARYALHSPEVVARMLNTPTLWRDVSSALSLWSVPLRELLAGRGRNVTVTEDMIESIDVVLNTLSSTGSAALAAAVIDERARLPAFSNLVGLDLEAFRRAILPSELIFADRFEVSAP